MKYTKIVFFKFDGKKELEFFYAAFSTQLIYF